ncbi:MAG: saccharopine dehydrogenase NADP-binding domain-containing protein [Bacteroidales bacterium]|nr:saccharopine dehydrogenase NADP-binding domain-containing protein [Bacteroidales bacterium]MBN2763917.1 saccharopine dehydrogenase NADP-binding domain-containing protein [Bacteroidales bacterium]
MKKILILGVGRSSSSLITYLEENARKYGWEITVGAHNKQSGLKRVSPPTQVKAFDVFNEDQLNNEVQASDVVVSMLPARFHPIVAMACLKYSKSMLTASYESDEILEMSTRAKSQGILFLNELGVDPGIDHMSAMRIINRIRERGHKLLCFESFTGGLIAPESDNNPWHYKITWNPRNVVLAGQGGPARFIQEGTFKYIPYHRLFRRTEVIDIEGYGKFEGYANRDSLKYIDKYNLQDVPTVYRGTLRRPGYCRAWDVFVQLGATDDSYTMQNTEKMTYKEFINSFLYYSLEDPVKTKLYQYMHIDQDSDVREKLEWLGIFDDTAIGLKNATPAQILEHIICNKWALEPDDKDMLVMWHKFIFQESGKQKTTLLTSSMVVTGDDQVNTAMAKTVGLPLAIAVKMVLSGQIRLTGSHIPTVREIYEPILNELELYGIRFNEKELA